MHTSAQKSQHSSQKIEQFWAEMRSTAYLFSKSTWPTASQTAKLIDQLGDILENRIITYPQVYSEFAIDSKTSYEDKRRLLGLDGDESDRYFNAENEEKEQRFKKFMLHKASQANKQNWSWRITQEANQKQLDKWYPFFVTLTIDPKKCLGQTHVIKEREVSYTSPRELWEKGREFRLYIRSLAEMVAQIEGHPAPRKKARNYKNTGVDYDYRPESDYITYAGVLEHGKSNDHHHMHLMLWLKNIPSHWKQDPNQGRLARYRTERECKSLRNYWYWCDSKRKPALYFRTKGDIWSSHGHTTPVDKRTGQPMPMLPVESVGNYVTKYMQKGTKVWHHRMKCTRNLGMQKIQKMIQQLDQPTLEALTWKPANSSHHHLVSSIHSVPIGIVRSLAKRQNFSLLWGKRQLDLKSLMKTNYDHYRRMLKSVRDGARPDRMLSAEFYDWVQQHLPETKGYCEKRLIQAHTLLCLAFPRQTYKIQPVVLPGNESGFTLSI